MRRVLVIAAVFLIFAVTESARTRAQDMRHRVYLPVVSVEPTPAAPTHWWAGACRGRDTRQLVRNGGFEEGEAGEPWQVVDDDDYFIPGAHFRPTTIQPFVQTDVVMAGRRAAVFPAAAGRDAEAVYVNGSPFIRYADPGAPGPQIIAARLSYWWYYQTSQPESFESDKLSELFMSCDRRGAETRIGTVPTYVSFVKMGRRDANQWRYREVDATYWMRRGVVADSMRKCLTLYWSSWDDGAPAAIYVDDVSLEVCE